MYAPYFKDKVDKNGKKLRMKMEKLSKKRAILTPVFDVEQTTGAELPQLVYNLERILATVKHSPELTMR